MALPSPQDIPTPGLGSAGPCGVQEPLQLAVPPVRGGGQPCSAATQGHLGHLSLAPHRDLQPHRGEGGTACAARQCESAWKYKGHYLQKEVWKWAGFMFFKHLGLWFICCVTNIDPECIVN